MINGKVLYATYNGIHVLRFIGDIRYTLSPSIDRFLKIFYALLDTRFGSMLKIPAPLKIEFMSD